MNKRKPNHNESTNRKLTCDDIKRRDLLVDYASGIEALMPEDVRDLEGHLETCPDCREEVLLMRKMTEESVYLDDACNAAMADIDWEENAETIGRGIPFKSPKTSPLRWSRGFSLGFSFNWRPAAAMATVFVLGIGLGYLLFGPRPLTEVFSAGETPPAISLAQLENSLTRREVKHYFQQSQLVMTDMMEQCNSDGSFSWKNRMDMRRVRTLLSKNRYFSKQTQNPDLSSSRELLKKIEWLLYEIVMNMDDNSCQNLEQLQKYIKQERLLLKIRLVGKELTSEEV
ncbi:MAG: hypothetical protein GY940_09105 [bacterium]|nr:hypothetical protein [bacterium]